MKVLVTGVAGFIGMHCAQRLLERGDEVVGIDNFSTYYSVELKKDRLARLKHARFEFQQVDLADAAALEGVFQKAEPDAVLHLAAQAGVHLGAAGRGGLAPSTPLDTGLARFAAWFKEYY
jgi:UDP-glucuronate 4-epimerase